MKTRMLLIVGFLVIPFVVQATEQDDMTRPIVNNQNGKAAQRMKQLKQSNGYPEPQIKPRNYQGSNRMNPGTN